MANDNHDAALQERYAKMSSNCMISIVGIDFAAKDPAMMSQVLAKAQQYLGNGNRIMITCSERLESGWLEWAMQVVFHQGGGLYIGCIQRAAGANVEFHS